MNNEVTNEKRFYVLVPETVQVVGTVDAITAGWVKETVKRSIPMCAGRLIAQSYHIDRKIESWRKGMNIEYVDTTAIVLSVRNTAELTKVSNELIQFSSNLSDDVLMTIYEDTNADFYGSKEKVHTATVIGPVYQEELDSVIGHLELYK